MLRHIQKQSSGFSLLEMTLVLLIFGILGSGLVATLSASLAANQQHESDAQLQRINDSILGFAIVNGRLPCPANPALAETDALAGQEDCSRIHGVLPWITLASPQTDVWGRRFTYFASDRFSGPALTPGGASFALDTAGNANIYDASGKSLALGLPFVVVSHGPNGNGGYLSDGKRFSTASANEAENADADLTFIQNLPSTLANDDILIWSSAELLKARLVSAGRLP